MAGPMPMNRLLQGDVGSGKTVVAVYAMLLAVAHGYQAVLMAPDGSARPATRPDAGADVGRQPGPPRLVDRRAYARPARRPAATDRRRRSRSGRRHAGDHSGGRVVRQARTGGDRRATQVRRASAGRAQGLRQNGDRHLADGANPRVGGQSRPGAGPRSAGDRSALPGDDRHAHPALGHDDAVRRSRRFHASRQSAGPAKGQHLSGQRGAAGQVVGFLPQEAPRGASGVRRHAAGRGIRGGRRRQPGRNLRNAGQRRAGGLSAGPDPRPHGGQPKKTP